MPNIGDICGGSIIGKKAGDKYIWASCSNCKKERWVVTYAKPFPTKCRGCSTLKEWGRIHDTGDGYKQIKIPHNHLCYPMADKHGRVRVHRLIMAENLGRVLEPWELVHHKDGNKLNNSLDNLEILKSLEHFQFEALIREVKILRARIQELESINEN